MYSSRSLQICPLSDTERLSPVSALRRGARCLRGPPRPPRVRAQASALLRRGVRHAPRLVFMSEYRAHHALNWVQLLLRRGELVAVEREYTYETNSLL